MLRIIAYASSLQLILFDDEHSKHIPLEVTMKAMIQKIKVNLLNS